MIISVIQGNDIKYYFCLKKSISQRYLLNKRKQRDDFPIKRIHNSQMRRNDNKYNIRDKQ